MKCFKKIYTMPKMIIESLSFLSMTFDVFEIIFIPMYIFLLLPGLFII